MKTFYITTPIYYVNDIPHIGHAYTSIAADVVARFKRLDGLDVHFLTGTDEHGQKIGKAAEKSKMDTQSFVDQAVLPFQELLRALNIANDDFIRTTEPRHKDYVTKIWHKLLENDFIYLSKYSGWYAIRDEAFYSAEELVDGKAPTGAEVEWVEEESYFFKLAAFEDKLLDFYEKNPDFIRPESKRNEVLSFVKNGLIDLSISRTTFSWGIPVPNEPKHIVYVWLDALFNYVSAIQSQEKYWPCDIHLIGKDILRFHAIYWPAFLMAADLPLPKQIFAHGWWTNAGVKISKSLGNVINPLDLIQEFGLDYVRYFLMRAIPFGNDGNYSKDQFIQLINAELANNIGNLTQRVISFVNKNCNSKVPVHGKFLEQDEALLKQSRDAYSAMQRLFDEMAIDRAIGVVVHLATAANAYIDSEAPWKLVKTDVQRMNTVLYVLLEIIRVIGLLLLPIIPDAANKMLSILNLCNLSFSDINNILSCDAIINTAQPIFPRIAI